MTTYKEGAEDAYVDLIATLELMLEDCEDTADSEELVGYINALNDVLKIIRDLRKELI